MPKGVPLQLYPLVHVPRRASPPPPRVVTDQDIEDACKTISGGGSIRLAADQLGVHPTTLWEALSGRGERAYARARELRALHNADQVVDVNRAVYDGELGHNEARVISGNLQWLAERQDGRRWGPKQQHEVKAEVGLTVNVVRRTDKPIASK